VHDPIFENWNLFGRGLMGGEHTGGVGVTPDISFAGGPGGGIEHTIGKKWGLRVSGDYIGAAFSVRNNTPQLGNSPHRTWNPRASVGVEYRF
jgi:hypothetical protein